MRKWIQWNSQLQDSGSTAFARRSSDAWISVKLTRWNEQKLRFPMGNVRQLKKYIIRTGRLRH